MRLRRIGCGIIYSVILIVFGIILGILVAYTNYWPPVVVVESDSMMHGDDSSLGTMDTGDLVLVKGVRNRNQIKTYIEGESYRLQQSRKRLTRRQKRAAKN